MDRLKFPIAVLLPVGLAFFASNLFGYSTGPDVGYSGVPNEGTCSDCHSGGKGSGSVTVTFPGSLTYTPGALQHLVVTVADSSQRRWGFQVTARQSSSSTTQAGAFTTGSDGYTQLVCTSSAFRTEQFGKSCAGSAT